MEAIHPQAATLDEEYKIRQWNQQSIEVVKGPAQHVIPLTLRMAARNRTRRAEGSRLEAEGLNEVDTYATNAKHPNEVRGEIDEMILGTMQTGSNWSKAVTVHTGMCEDDVCDLCKEAKETSDHIWYCRRLKEKAKELDPELAEADPEDFTPAMRHGVACAMHADPRKTYWGYECKEEWHYKKKWMYGCIREAKVRKEVMEVMKDVGEEGIEEVAAREIMEALMTEKGDEVRVKPNIKFKIKEKAPLKPNAFSDGSLKNTKGYFWQMGGAGVWHPERKV
jgi:hypothetical protein